MFSLYPHGHFNLGWVTALRLRNNVYSAQAVKRNPLQVAVALLLSWINSAHFCFHVSCNTYIIKLIKKKRL